MNNLSAFTLPVILILIFLAVLIVLVIILLVRQSKNSVKEFQDAFEDELDRQLSGTRSELVNMIGTVNGNNVSLIQSLQKTVTDNQRLAAEQQRDQVGQLQLSLNNQLEQTRNSNAEQLAGIHSTISRMEQTNGEKLENIRNTVSVNLKDLREENSKKLDEIRGTVDEKLQTTLEKRISESFKTVSDQLEQVYKSMGEMQTLATDVGGLKKVLSGVKTRGILGEVQLGAILQEILAPEQYEMNVATVPGSSERVEFAVKLPGGEGYPVYLPIDSKFPGERYAQLLQAQEAGDRVAAENAYKALETVIKLEAKDISEKYISVPYTTNFGIMFLPFEGLYAEVVNRGLLEVLQRDYRVNIAGPSTMAAYLNSLQMGFRTLAIQENAGKVWEVLGAVKTEFDNFETVMTKMQTHLRQTSDDLEKLSGTRTRAIRKKLREVESIDITDASRILELDVPDEEE